MKFHTKFSPVFGVFLKVLILKHISVEFCIQNVITEIVL